MSLDGWWRDAFERGAYPLARIADTPLYRGRTRREVPFLASLLGLRRGDALLDLCCGIGRHAIPFARRGLRVTGADISRAFLREAARRAGRAGVAPRLVRADMRALPFRAEFDAVVNLWSSFGYFPRAADDLRALRSAARALKPGGRLFLDTFNGPRFAAATRWIMARDLPLDRWSELPDGTLALESPRLSARGDAFVTRWRFLRAGRERRMDSFLRVYTRARLARLLRECGFRVARFFGEIGPGRYDPRRSQRLAVLAVKR